MDDSAIMSNEVIEETKTVPIDFNEEEVACKTKNFCNLLAFSLITIALWIAVSIYCYLIEYRKKEKHLLPFYVTYNKLKVINSNI